MSRDLAGKTAGGFRLGDIIARGASSTVYAAEPTAGGQQAAVKVLSYDLARDKNAATKLVAEVQRATGIKHKNLVPVLEVGTVELKGKRYLYIAMERLHGESLKARLQSQPSHALPLHIALQLAGEVGGALQAIQRAGVTHRQVNPGAVFLVPPTDEDRRADPEAEEQVYLLDLGVALVPTETAKDGVKPAKPGKPQDDVRGLAQLVQDMLGGLPDSVAAGKNAVLPLRWRNRKVPARIDAVLRQAVSDSASNGPDKGSDKGSDKGPDKNNDKGGRIDSVATLLAELLGVGDALPTLHAWSEDGRAVMPKPARSWNLAWAAGLALLGGAGVGYWMYTQEPTTTPAAIVDLAGTAPADLAKSVVADLGAGLLPKVGDNAENTPQDAGTADLRVRVWPRRTGPKMPPLREADPVPPTPAPAAPGTAAGAASPAAPKSTPPAATNQQPTGNPGTSPPSARPARVQEVK